MDDNSSGIPKKKDLHTYELSGKVMLFSVVTLILFLLLILLFHFSRFRRRPSSSASSLPFSFCRRGLDSSTLNSIPTFSYAAASHPKLLDCAVCLSDFHDGDSGRVLPDCRHCFHVHCIDAWFKHHSNCPLCRSPVNPSPAEIAIPVGQFCGAPEGALAPVECRRKSPETQGWFGLRRESEPGGSGSKGPESGVLDLKKLLTLEHMTG